MSGGASTQQLERWCSLHKAPHFVGVFASDEKPDLRGMQEARVIFNWSPHTSGGSHWVSFQKRGDVGYWFDPMGLPPSSGVETDILGGKPEFRKWIESQVNRFHFNSKQIEAITGRVCGQYACWATLNGSPQLNPEAWEWVTSDPQVNDVVIARMIVL